jgi:hypothetical protein
MASQLITLSLKSRGVAMYSRRRERIGRAIYVRRRRFALSLPYLGGHRVLQAGEQAIGSFVYVLVQDGSRKMPVNSTKAATTVCQP